METSQYIYLYDLPKEDVSSIKLAEVFKDKAGVALIDSQKPQIKYDITKPFYSAMVSIKDADQFKNACDKMRYFEIEGKPCRALPFDRQLLGSNKEKLLSHNVFVRSIPKEMNQVDLHKHFEQFGPIKSLKISLNPDHKSRGYGFICYENPESATAALHSKPTNGMDIVKFEPKDNKGQLRKLMNNIYVKNIPHSYTQDDVKKMFEAYGHIFSLVIKSSEIGQFAFVCYDDPAGVNKEYGPQCAQKAIEALNNKELVDGDKKVNLVVRNALKKAERQVEKLRETIRYKNSKKRCNLYVKNFPNSYKKEQLESLFKQYGEIENIRLDMGKSKNAFAFVCFKEPTDAAKAKAQLHNHTIDGKQLVIYYYEIKELRQLQNEQAKDKADWEKYQAAQTGGFQWNELTNLPNLSQILTTLMQVIHAHEQQNAQNNQQERQMYKGGDRRRNPGQGRHPGHQGGFHNQNQGGAMQGNNMISQQQQMMMQQQMAGLQAAGGMPQPGMPLPHGGRPAPPGMPPAAMPAPPQGQAGAGGMGGGVRDDYLNKARKILPAVQARNQQYQEQVGQVIYDFILGMVGPEAAPKITGMLIDLPIVQIHEYLGSYDALQAKVMEARNHLQQQMGEGK